MSKPPPHSGRGKKFELPADAKEVLRQNAAKHPRPWNSGTSPVAKGKSTASTWNSGASSAAKEKSTASPSKHPSKQLPKQQPKLTPKQPPKLKPKELPKRISRQPPNQLPKASSDHSNTARNTVKRQPTSAKNICEQSLFQKNNYESEAALGPPTKKLPAPVLGSRVGSLLRKNHSSAKDYEYVSSLERSSGNLNHPSKASNTCDTPLQNDKGPDSGQIFDKDASVLGVPSSDIEAKRFFRRRFVAESDEEQDAPLEIFNETVICARMQPSRRTGKLRSPVGTPEDESGESWLPTDNGGGDWMTWRPPNRVTEPIPDPGDRVDELRSVPMRAMFVPGGVTPPARQMEATYPTPEAHILAIDPNITLHSPRSRRSATVSDPVHPTAPRHRESLNHQAGLYYTEICYARMAQNDDNAFQRMTKAGDLEPRDSKSTCQPADQESAYQAMLKKAHYKPDQDYHPKPLHWERHRKSERREKDDPFSRILIQEDAPEEDLKIVMKPAPATIGRYLQPSSQNIIRTNGPIANGVVGKSHKAELKKDNATRNSRVPQERSPRYKLIREPLSPNKNITTGQAENSFKRDGWYVDRQEQQMDYGKAGFPRPNSTVKSALDPIANNHNSTPPAVPPAIDHRLSSSSPRRTQNKSVSWDPAITHIGPVVQRPGERKTAEALFEKLFMKDESKEAVAVGQEICGDVDVDTFVSTFKRWKKGDKDKLDSLLKALREIDTDTDTDTDSAHGDGEDMQDNTQNQKIAAAFNPQVPDFKPFTFQENEICIQKVRSQMPATLATSVTRPIAPATINIPLRVQANAPRPVPYKFENIFLPYQCSLRCNTRPNSGTEAQPIKKRVIWDNPEDPGGREAVMQSQRWAGELLEQFTKKYPLTGQKASVVPKKRLEDLPKAKSTSNTLKVAKMVSKAADIQQKLEVLLMQKKEAKAKVIR